MPRIGIDLGGTKIEGIVLSADGSVTHRERVATPAGDYRATIQAVAALAERLESACGQPCTVGVGTPGSASPGSGRLRNANSTCLNGSTLTSDLGDLLKRPVRIANDADCLALSEARDGAAAGANVVFGVIIGTGTGGGLVVNGTLLSGANAIAGEWGHNPLPWPRDEERPGPACYCGRHGCIETFLSGPALLRDFGDPSTTHVKQIVDRAQQGDPDAQACLARYENRLARGLASVINIVDPDVIVLGGGLSNIRRLYTNVPAQWEALIFSDVVATRLVPPVHGDSSGVRGAAGLWPEPADKA